MSRKYFPSVQRKIEDLDVSPDLKIEWEYGLMNPELLDDEKSSVPPRHEMITFERFVEHCPSPDCKACAEGTDDHTAECRKRFDHLIRKDKFEFPAGIPKEKGS